MALTYSEIAWAKECVAAGDSLSEVAHECEVGILVLARELGLYGWRPRSLRWRPSRREREPAPWIGGMLREVAIARCRAGDDPRTLAAEAQVTVDAMRKLCAGIQSVRPQGRWAHRSAA